MAFLDHQGESEFPYSKEIVFEAICKAVPTIDGMNVHTSDKLSGRILVKAGISFGAMGESIPIQLTSITDIKTKVQITSTPKFGILGVSLFGIGRNRKNIEQIFAATSAILSKLQSGIQPTTSTATTSGSIADQIQKLKHLLDSGILTQEEFNQQKAKLLL